MGEQYQVIEYKVENLISVFIAQNISTLPTVINCKLHIEYFKNYFKDLKAKTIIVESKYIDRDFLEDHAGYYDRCFEDFPSTCSRLHFFDIEISSEIFSEIIEGNYNNLSEENFLDSYLGFVVLKPLPKTLIGRTCLKTYDNLNGERNYPITRIYKVSLFGINLTVDTLAFQEQDSIAAACATSALWSTFQGTGKIFQHAIPSPVEITKLATKLPDESVPGTLPNHGLTGRQMIYAIRQLGLEPLKIDAEDEFILKSTVYAYLKAGVPLILVIGLFDTSTNPDQTGEGHAVAITGYREGLKQIEPYDIVKFRLQATKIDKLYVHDDQVGPFAKMIFDGKKIDLSKYYADTKREYNSMHTSWRGRNQIIGSVRAAPDYLLIPLYSKIRIEFTFIRKVIFDFDWFVRQIIDNVNLGIPSKIDWDIYLIKVNDLKNEIFESQELDRSVRRTLLLENLPRFIWRAQAKHEDKVALDLLFDATGIEQSRFFIKGINYSSNLYKIIELISKNYISKTEYQKMPYWRIIEWFAKQK